MLWVGARCVGVGVLRMLGGVKCLAREEPCGDHGRSSALAALMFAHQLPRAGPGRMARSRRRGVGLL